jgi:hypothetical protein
MDVVPPGVNGSPDFVSDPKIFPAETTCFVKEDASDPELSSVLSVVPNLAAVYYLTIMGLDAISIASHCEADRVAIEQAAIPFLVSRSFLKPDGKGGFAKGAMSPLFICDSNAPKPIRLRWLQQSSATLNTLSKLAVVSLPLVAFTNFEDSTDQQGVEVCNGLMRVLGFIPAGNESTDDVKRRIVEETKYPTEDKMSEDQESDVKSDVIAFTFVIKIPNRKGDAK